LRKRKHAGAALQHASPSMITALSIPYEQERRLDPIWFLNVQPCPVDFSPVEHCNLLRHRAQRNIPHAGVLRRKEEGGTRSDGRGASQMDRQTEDLPVSHQNDATDRQTVRMRHVSQKGVLSRKEGNARSMGVVNMDTDGRIDGRTEGRTDR
jgi:hypothetical protein